MPGIFRNFRQKRQDRIDRKAEMKRHQLSKKERQGVVSKLAAGFKPVHTTPKQRPKTAQDHFYLAKAERKRYWRGQRRINEALAGGWGEHARFIALRATAPSFKDPAEFVQ